VSGSGSYWCGVLPHNGQPGRTYREIARLGAELETASELVAGLTPDADLAMIYSMPSKWLMQKYPPLAHEDGSPDARAYHGLFDPFYRGAFDAGLQARIIHASQLFDREGGAAVVVRRFPVLVAAGMYIADDETLDGLVAYVAAGGHLVLGQRTAYADHEGRARSAVMPARTAEAAGVWYDEFSNLSVELPVVPADGSGLRGPAGAAGVRWTDGLQVTGAQVLAGYEHPHFGQWPAITTKPHGKGRTPTSGRCPTNRWRRRSSSG
jgi:beta-galactosidase